VLHDEVRTIFQRSIQEAKRAGLLGGGPLRIAVDTKPILGRGAVEDTYNLLATGIQQLVRALAGMDHQDLQEWASGHDLTRYFGQSLKGSADLDWSDASARNQFLTEIVTDARRLLRLAAGVLVQAGQEEGQPVREAAALLEALLLQDVVETKTPGGGVKAAIKEGTTPGRIPSATDPEVRHGRKSKTKRFDGHKAAVATDLESQIIVDAEVLAGDAPDAQDVLQQLERVEQNTGQQVQQTIADCAYGSGATRQAFTDAGRELVAKVPQQPSNHGRFPKSAFVLDLGNDTVTCPDGETTSEFTLCKDGSKVFHFRDCINCWRQDECTTAAGGRTIQVHPQEALLQAARAYQQTEEGQRTLRQRVVAEHRLARLGQLQIGQARYLGRKKTRGQLLLAATVANLRRTWNWEQTKAREGQPSSPSGASIVQVAQETLLAAADAICGWLRRSGWPDWLRGGGRRCLGRVLA
jgi:hypothetical protein